ncbi:blue light sensor protein [Xenophilus sp. AP218F]|nr:BLUF domain-containing protein [Chromobacterium sp. ASV5]OWY40111.1 blue light sensor protein [Xenophilus sp. AP218F]
MLVSLTYCSYAKKTIDSELMSDILAAARKHNPEQGITGLLCVSHNIFVQTLEGSRQQVNQLYQKLAKDSRHHSLTLLDYREVEQRRFANWSMAEVMLDKVNASQILRYSTHAKLDPFNQPGSSTVMLLEALADSGTTQFRH